MALTSATSSASWRRAKRARVADPRLGQGQNRARGDRGEHGQPERAEGIGECAGLPEEASDGQNHGGGDEPRAVQAEERCAKCVRHWLPVGFRPRYLIRVTSLKIGRYIATTRPPTITPRNTIMIGSSSEVSVETAVSTSSS